MNEIKRTSKTQDVLLSRCERLWFRDDQDLCTLVNHFDRSLCFDFLFLDARKALVFS